ncbi:M90 family metallopeptidase [Taibaiella koreensis]|uniref:M90 family metallopeptidase n=1 Tax=Taibaiella koreensis TaxID=1268548 RepID=UPI000E59C4EC|nr:M90 family metallopeptidase [Taibaiella koreensis]
MRVMFIVLVTMLILFYLRSRKKKPAVLQPVIAPDHMHTMLEAHVAFYRKLDQESQGRFRSRVQHFLDTTRISPVDGVTVTELDRLYVASSAIIPIFHFDDWAYNNLDEVLLYPGTFSQDLDHEAAERNVLGMVGDGAMHRMMILSQPALRSGFEQSGAGNTGIHEFVHLLDKADGATDGVPEYMIPKDLVAPWMRQMHRTIQQIREGESDINPYAGTNEAEFFAVLSEYFFQKPQFLKEHHPELYAILDKVYHR